MYKGKIALILSLLMLFNIFLPSIPIVYADTLSAETINDIQTLGAYQRDIFANDLLLNSSVSIDDIETYLTQYGKKYPLVSDDRKYRLNPYVYKKYKVVAYTNEEAYNAGIAGLTNIGSPKKETQSITLSGGIKVETIDEYRYLGYKKNGTEIITNDFFPADFKSSVDMRDKSWVMNDPQVKSWNENVLEDPNALYYHLETKVLNDENFFGLFEQTDYSIADLVGSNNYDTLTRYPKVMSDVTFSNPLVLNMVHRSGGTLWYDTMRLKQYSYDLDTKIDNVVLDVNLPVGTESYDITYDVTTAITDVKTDGKSQDGKYFSNIEINSNGTDFQMFNNDTTVNRDLPLLKETDIIKTDIIKTVDLKGVRIGETKTLTLNAKSIITTFDDNVRVHDAKPVKVNITLHANDFVDFGIKKNETDLTDATAIVSNIANPNLTLTLHDLSFVESGDITSHVYKVITPTGEVFVSGGNNPVATYTITGANKDCIIDGKVTFVEYVSTVNDVVGSAKHIVNIKEKDTTSTSGGVVAVLTSKADFNENKDYYEVMEGETFKLRGNESYHEADLELTDYSFDVGEDFDEGIMLNTSKKSARAFYPKSDGGAIYKAYLEVTDEVGAKDTDSIRTKVLPARFEPKIEINGSFKENRKLSFFVENKKNLTYYPIDESSLEWTITPLDGQGDVFQSTTSLNGNFNFDGQFKLKGRYKIRVEGEISSIYNPVRYHGSAERIITIAEDLPPVADFVVDEIRRRDVENGLMTDLYLYDKSGSKDDDIISQRIGSIKFDSDNDGLWDDETSIVFAVGNETIISFPTDHVGNYKFEMKVKEEFGQPSISSFVSDSDKRRGDTSNKPNDKKITELRNVPPTMDLDVSQRKNVNVIIYEDLNTSEKSELESKLTELEIALLAKKINLKKHYLKPTQTVGNRKIWTTYFDTYINVKVHAKGDDEDRDEIDWVQDMTFLLDSYSLDGGEGEVEGRDLNRFELIGVRWGNSGYGKYKYKNRKKDYTSYNWKELIVTYKENGVQKEITYNYVYDYERLDLEGNSNRHDAFTYDSYDIVGIDLVVDQPYIERLSFVEPNNTFRYSAATRPKLILPSNTSRTVALKKYSDIDLNNILSESEGEDTFFINLASKEENRLALNIDLSDKLRDNNITYLTLEDYKIRVNPLTGRFDALYQGDRIGRDWVGHWSYYSYYINRVIAVVGNFAYEIDEENGRYMFMGLADRYKDQYEYSVENNFMNQEPSIYTNGYTYENRWGNDVVGYGTTALKERCYDMGEVDVRRIWDNWEDSQRDQGLPYDWRTFINTNFTDKWYRSYLHMLGVEDNGSIWGYYLEYDRYNDEFEYKYKQVASGGYKGVINLNLKTSTDAMIRGYVHDNGNIYFKDMAIYGGNFTPYDYLVVTEGVDNIRLIQATTEGDALFVYTDTSVIKYDFKARKRVVLVAEYIERKGTSVKIAENKWMIGDVVYDGYKEIYTNDLTGRWGSASFERKDRYHSVPAYNYFKYYIDLEGNLYEDREWDCDYGYGHYEFTEHNLIATEVESIPFMQYLSKFPTPRDVHGNFVRHQFDGRWHNAPEFEYNILSRYVKGDGHIYDRNGTKAFASPLKNVESVGVISKRNSYGNYQDNWGFLVGLVDGTFGISNNFSYIKPVKYANLTVGSAGDVVGDNMLTSVTSQSTAYDTLEELKNGIYDIYKNYSTSASVTILLGETINTSMVMQDVEDDPAYVMTYTTEHLNPNYYENSMGRDPNVGVDKLLTKFDYVGQYKILPRGRDNPVGDDDRFDNYRLWNKDDTSVIVNVHRKPMAYFTTSIVEDNGKMTLSAKDNGSYDLDHESQANKGIIKWEWSLKGKDDVSWQKYDGQSFTVSNLSSDTSYYLALRVQDEELVWSTPVIKTIESTNVPIGLTAKLKSVKTQFSPLSIPITEDLLLYDIQTTYPKALKLKVGFYKDDTLIGTEKKIEFIEGDTGVTIDALFGHREWSAISHEIGHTVADGSYTLKIEAVDVSNASKSESIEFSVGVRTPIKPEPTLEEVWITDQTTSMQCSTSIYTDEVKVKLFKGTPDEVTVQMTYDGVDLDKEEKMWMLAYEVPEDIINGLHIMEFIGVVHTSPYKRESKLETVQVVSLGFEEVILTGAWNHWRGQVDLFGEQLQDMPHRFLSWEKIYISTKTLGNPDRVTLELSPELQAMSFTDDNGKTFYYEDDFDEEVEFPLEFTKEADNLWTTSYILPLADSSLSWENERKRAPYEITVSAYKNGIKRVYEFNEANGNAIEITGNTTNLIYQQPAADRE